ACAHYGPALSQHQGIRFMLPGNWVRHKVWGDRKTPLGLWRFINVEQRLCPKNPKIEKFLFFCSESVALIPWGEIHEAIQPHACFGMHRNAAGDLSRGRKRR